MPDRLGRPLTGPPTTQEMDRLKAEIATLWQRLQALPIDDRERGGGSLAYRALLLHIRRLADDYAALAAIQAETTPPAA